MTVFYLYECCPRHRFRPDQLALAFDRIRDHKDWKAPLRATIHATDRAIVTAAIHWFTGTNAEFTVAMGSPDHLLVTAPGQRRGPQGHPDDIVRGRMQVTTRSHQHVALATVLEPQK